MPTFKLNDFNPKFQEQIRRQLGVQPQVAGQVAKLEPNPCDAPLAAQEVQRPTNERVLVRIGSRRKRLIDQDNLCEKYLVDLLRYGGVIPDDSPDKCEIEVSQTKCKKGEPEEITIEVTRL